MNITTDKIEKREEELAKQTYQMRYVDLPGYVKVSIHNTVLEEFGMTNNSRMVCSKCGNTYEEEGEIEEIDDFIEGVCHSCNALESIRIGEEKLDKIFEEFERTLISEKNLT